MSKKFNRLYNDIINDRNPLDNIPEFLEMAVEKYSTYASVRLALNYYSYNEIYWDERENWSDKLQGYTKDINTIISEALLLDVSNEEHENTIKRIDDIRNSVTKSMEKLTLYVDLFDIYEYALNRVEYRFTEMEELEDDETLAKEILRFVFDSEDNMLINERIKDIIGQLPVRITKNKYFDFISDSLYELIGANKDIFDTYIYIIRSCAMLDVSQDMKDAYPELWDKKEKLEKFDFKAITKNEYEYANTLLQEAVRLLELESTAFYVLIEVINELYSLLLCNPYIGQTDNEHRGAALDIIKDIYGAYSQKIQIEPSSDILSRFSLIEGIQEDMEYDIIGFDDALYHIDKHHRSLVNDMDKIVMLDSLLISKDLHSGSLFIDINNSSSEEYVGKEEISKEIDKLIKELEVKFQGSDRIITRAIMAATMNKMPVFFNTHTEIMEYVLYSLNKCTDIAEKYASIEIINNMMDE